MYSHREVASIAQNVFKVTLCGTVHEERASYFVQAERPDTHFTGECACTADAAGLLRFSLNGREVLREIATPFTLGFGIAENDAVYGLGLHQQTAFNRRGTVCQMLQNNGVSTAVPFMTSNGGYALLFDTCAFMSVGIDKPCTTEYHDTFDTAERCPNEIHVFADDAAVFTYYVILDERIDGQIAAYRALTGHAPLFPKWAYGFFQSREHYGTQEEILSVAREFRRRHIPLDCIVQDWNYWGEHGWNAIKWDADRYPNPTAMTQAIHDMDMKIIISVWPSVGPQTKVCKELEAVGGILEKPGRSGENWGRVHDPFNPKAAAIVWDYMRRNLWDSGVDGWWLDSTEPDIDGSNSKNLRFCCDTARGPTRRFLNAYALAAVRNTYCAQRAAAPDRRVFILTRSGWAGQQCHAAATWTGDVTADWDVFRNQLNSLLSFSLSGVPYSTTDIGGFWVREDFPDGNQNPAYRELYTRWFWFGVFSPLFRSHGTSTPREMWFFGDKGDEHYEAQLAASRLRYTLMPYIYATAFRVYDEGYSFLRPLAAAFNDTAVTSTFDTYMFGDSLLVHIVTAPAQREAAIYLPRGCDWYDYFTAQKYEGGTTVTTATPLSTTPLFVKSGSILLTAAPAECTARQDNTRLTVKVFTGRDAATFHYVDDGDGYAYENGVYMKIPFTWDDADRTLTVGTPAGDPRFDPRRTLTVEVNGVPCGRFDYSGETLEIRL
ncbi:MAG: DUF5110 domain-containing protein [Ruminococcaceae bacterium]|nr:DUF5110 domain-containing protein [Oscillospiraceae bacterium]